MLKRFTLLALYGTALAQAAGPTPNRLDVVLNGQPRVLEYRLWSDHPYAKLKDTYKLDWMPYLDAVHNLADIAACIRLEPNSSRVTAVMKSKTIKGAALGTDLPKLSAPTRTIQGEMWLPLDSVAEAMGYKAQFDAKAQKLTLKSSVEPLDFAFPNYCQYVLQKKE